MDLVGKQGKLTGILMTGNLSWDCMGCYGSVWEFMGFYGIYCDSLGFIGILWDFIRTLIIFASLRTHSDRFTKTRVGATTRRRRDGAVDKKQLEKK